jgi:hypothetical protein
VTSQCTRLRALFTASTINISKLYAVKILRRTCQRFWFLSRNEVTKLLMIVSSKRELWFIRGTPDTDVLENYDHFVEYECPLPYSEVRSMTRNLTPCFWNISFSILRSHPSFSILRSHPSFSILRSHPSFSILRSHPSFRSPCRHNISWRCWKVFHVVSLVPYYPSNLWRKYLIYRFDFSISNVYHLSFTAFFILLYSHWPPLWSSGQSSWLQIRRPGFDSRHYQKKK